MNKSIKYSINGALLGGTFNAILNALIQYSETNDDEFDWNNFLKSFATGALVGGATGFIVGAIRDNKMNNVLVYAGGAAGVLKQTLERHNAYSNEYLLCKAQEIQANLDKEFGLYLSEYPLIQGSHEKGTAISDSDIDIHIKLNKNFGTIGEVRGYIEDYFKHEYKDAQLIRVRSQEWSIGLFFSINGEEKRIDIVPMREVENGKGDTFIYSKKQDSIKKTNANRQRAVLTFTAKQKNIIKLLKGWKKENGLKISSTYIELLVKRAFNEIAIPRGIDKTLLVIIEYIANNITTLRIVDPANTNNVISENLTRIEKIEIQDFCIKMLDDIRKDNRNILDYFKN